MNALAANDFQAAGLLAPARPGGGAPGRCGPRHGHSLAAPYRT